MRFDLPCVLAELWRGLGSRRILTVDLIRGARLLETSCCIIDKHTASNELFML
jgi:hypothetical protein